MLRYLSCIALCVAGLASAHAADFPAYKPSSPAAPPAFRWTGCYIGAHAGGGVLFSDYNSTNGGGAVAGGQLGCNYQIGQLVFGVEGEGYWSGISSTFNQQQIFSGLFPSVSTFEAKATNEWDATAAIRFGFIPVERLLVYGKAGAAVGHFTYRSSSIFTSPGFISVFTTSGHNTFVGALVGVGGEYALSPNWTAKVEYNYINYLSDSVALTCTGCGALTTTLSADKHILKVGFNYLWTGVR